MKVLILGATGNLGPYIVRGLLDNGHSVTALSRPSSTSKAPHGIASVTADYSSLDSLTTAFKGFDAVISTIGDVMTPSGVETQIRIIDACIAAGVKRFIPSEFGSDDNSAISQTIPIYNPKQSIRKYLHNAAEAGKIEYTEIFNAPFVEWMLSMPGLGFNAKERKVELFDDSSLPFPMTPLSIIGSATGVALRKSEETKNKIIIIRGCWYSQDEVLKIFEEETGQKWEVKRVKSEEVLKAGQEMMKKDPGDFNGIFTSLKGCIYDQKFNAAFADEEGIRKNNELLEVKPLDKEGLRGYVKNALKGLSKDR